MGRHEGTVQFPGREGDAFAAAANCSIRSGVNLDRCLVQDLSFWQRFLTLMIPK